MPSDQPIPRANGDDFKSILRRQLTTQHAEQDLRTWFDPLRITYDQGRHAVEIHFPHPYFGEWFLRTMRVPFETSLFSFLDDDTRIAYGPETLERSAPSLPMAPNPDGECTFDNFLVNKKNYFPLISAREIVGQDEVKYNPYIVAGDNGTGKTHLLKAIAKEYRTQSPDRSVLYATVDDLHSLYSAHYKNSLDARNHVLGHDVLLVDEIQELAKFTHLQQELLTVFNTFHDHKRQMVFGCTGRISGLDFLDPKLKSRLEWGLIVTLKRPDLDIRLKYVQAKSLEYGLGLTKARVLDLAQRFQDFRSLQGVVIKLVAYKELVRGDLNDQDCRQILDSLEDRPLPPLTPEQIIQTVADHFQITREALQSSQRHHQVVLARQVAMTLCRKLLGLSFPHLGRLFGGKDHSTVLYAVKKIKELQGNNKDIKNMLMEIEDKCRSPRR